MKRKHLIHVFNQQLLKINLILNIVFVLVFFFACNLWQHYTIFLFVSNLSTQSWHAVWNNKTLSNLTCLFISLPPWPGGMKPVHCIVLYIKTTIVRKCRVVNEKNGNHYLNSQSFLSLFQSVLNYLNSFLIIKYHSTVFILWWLTCC